MPDSVCILKHGCFSNPRVLRDAHALAHSGFAVDVICLRESEDAITDLEGTISVYRIPLSHKRQGLLRYIFEYSVFTFCCFVLLSLLHPIKRYRLIQSINMPDFLVFAAIVPKLFGAKIVLAMPEPAPELLTITRNPHPRLWSLLTWVQNKSCSFADRVFPVTERMKRHLCNNGTPSSKQMVVLNVPDDTIFRQEVCYRASSSQRFTLVYAGSILERFGIETMLRAISLIRVELPLMALHIYGAGEFDSKARRLVQELGIQQHVVFHGFISPYAIPSVLHTADVCLVPILRNSYSELVHTHKMFEAVAAMRPAVVSRLPVVLDYFSEDSLFFFTPGDHEELARCVVRLFRNADKRNDLVRKSWRRYQQLRWSVAKQAYLQDIHRLLGTKSAMLNEAP